MHSEIPSKLRLFPINSTLLSGKKMRTSYIILLLSVMLIVSLQVYSEDWESSDDNFTTAIAVGDLDIAGFFGHEGRSYQEVIAGNYSYPYGLQSSPTEWHLSPEGEFGGYLVYYYNDDGDLSTTPINISDDKMGINCIDLGDFDKDGDLDIAVGNLVLHGGDGQDRIFVNQYVGSGEISFIEDDGFNIVTESFDTQAIKWVDVDSDGDLDLAVLEWGGDLRLYENEPESDFGFVEHRYSLGERKKPKWISPEYESNDRNTFGANNYDEISGSVMEWYDVDDDGFIDVFINYGRTPIVYKNLFDQGSSFSGIFDKEHIFSLQASITDYSMKRAGCAAFKKYEGDIYLAVGCNSFVKHPRDPGTGQIYYDRGVSVYKFVTDHLEDIWQEEDASYNGENAKMMTDIEWLYNDIITVSYPALKKVENQPGDFSLVWNRGETQLYENDEYNSFSDFSISVINEDIHSKSSSIAIGSLNETFMPGIVYLALEDISGDELERGYHIEEAPICDRHYVQLGVSDDLDNTTFIVSTYGMGGDDTPPYMYVIDRETGFFTIDPPDLTEQDWITLLESKGLTQQPFFITDLYFLGTVPNSTPGASQYYDVVIGNDGANLACIDDIDLISLPGVQPSSPPDLLSMENPISHGYPSGSPSNVPSMDTDKPLGMSFGGGHPDSTYDVLEFAADNYPDVNLWYYTCYWSEETMMGKYYWDQMDNCVNIAFQNGKELILGTRFAPTWTMGDYNESGTKTYEKKIIPCDATLSANFAQMFVNRYRPGGICSNLGANGVKRYQYMNEPGMPLENGNNELWMEDMASTSQHIYCHYQVTQRIALNTSNDFIVISPNFSSGGFRNKVYDPPPAVSEYMFDWYYHPYLVDCLSYFGYDGVSPPLEAYVDEISFQIYASTNWTTGWQFDSVDPLTHWWDYNLTSYQEESSFLGTIKLLNYMYDVYEEMTIPPDLSTTGLYPVPGAADRYSTKKLVSIEWGHTPEVDPYYVLSQVGVLFSNTDGDQTPLGEQYNQYLEHNFRWRWLSINGFNTVPQANIGTWPAQTAAYNNLSKLLRNEGGDPLIFDSFTAHDPNDESPANVEQLWLPGSSDIMPVADFKFTDAENHTELRLLRTDAGPRTDNLTIDFTTDNDYADLFDAQFDNFERCVISNQLTFYNGEVDSFSILALVDENTTYSGSTQEIYLTADNQNDGGWNYVSLFVSPFDPLTNPEVAQLFDSDYNPYNGTDFLPGLSSVRDYLHNTGDAFDPEDWNGTNFALDLIHGYAMKVKMTQNNNMVIHNAGSIFYTPDINGFITIDNINPEPDIDDPQYPYWFWITVPYPQAFLIDDILSVYDGPFKAMIDNDKLQIIKDESGKIYNPDLPPERQGFHYLFPGKMYVLGFNEDNLPSSCNFAKFQTVGPLPGPESLKPGQPNSGSSISSSFDRHFTYCSRTIDFYPIIVDSFYVDGIEPEIGDEIGVFTPDNVCVGGYVYAGENSFSFPAWKDDPTTEEIDGYCTGEAITFVFWDASEDEEYTIELSYSGISSLGLPTQPEDPDFPSNPCFGQGFGGQVELHFTNPTPPVIPSSFALQQNYPNPFNPSTTIAYSLPELSQVKISVFNIMGQEVAVLIEGQQSAGYKKVVWSGCDNGMAYLSSGVYFVRMKARGKDSGKQFNDLKKMLLIK